MRARRPAQRFDARRPEVRVARRRRFPSRVRRGAPNLHDREAVKEFVADHRCRTQPTGAREGARRAAEGQERALRKAERQEWYESEVRPALIALAALNSPFTVDDLHPLVSAAGSPGALGASFGRARSEGLIRQITPPRPARSTSPRAHRRPVGTWIGATAPLAVGYDEAAR